MKKIFAQPTSTPYKKPATPAPTTSPTGGATPAVGAGTTTPSPGATPDASKEIITLLQNAGLTNIVNDLNVAGNNYVTTKSNYETFKKDFDAKSKNCMAMNFKAVPFNGPCSYVDVVGKFETETSISADEMTQLYQKVVTGYTNFINAAQKQLDIYNSIIPAINGLPPDKRTTFGENEVSSVQRFMQTGWNEVKQYKIDQLAWQRNYEAYFNSAAGKTILQCYEEIIELMTDSCNTAVEFNKILSLSEGSTVPGLGIGPVGPLAMKLISDYEACARIFAGELTPIYKTISAGGDPKRISRNIQMISVTIPTSFKGAANRLRMAVYNFALTNDRKSFSSLAL